MNLDSLGCYYYIYGYLHYWTLEYRLVDFVYIIF